MTHLGLVSATAVCSRGFKTICYDANAALVERLSRGELPVLEPQLDELLVANADRQIFSSEIKSLTDCDLVYIAPDVPTDEAGASDLSGITRMIADVIPNLGPKAVLVVLCQVPPGFTRGLNMPPERLIYQVETLIFGRAVERATHPERYIIGCADPDAPLPHVLKSVLGAFECPILPMRYESAELAKIAINMCLVASIGVANTMAELSEKIGANWHEIVPALKLDARIGAQSYLSPGLGIAGGNLERDLATVIRLADETQSDAGIVRAWLANSRRRRDWAADTIRAVIGGLRPDPLLAVWGLAYKENTASVKNSPSLATIRQFPDLRMRLHDPVVPGKVIALARAETTSEALAAVEGADVLAILTPWPEYRAVKPRALAEAMRGGVVIDPYRVMNGQAVAKVGLNYHTLGMPSLASC